MLELDFFTFVYGDIYKYAEYLKHTCDTFASGNIKINYKYIESIKTNKAPKGYDFVTKTNKSVFGDSFNHSVAVNEAFKHVDSKYVVFSDADIAITYKNWDELVIDKLNSGLSCFGFDYYQHSRRYFNFPNVFFFCFRYDMIGNIGIDFKPRIKDGKIDYEIISDERKSCIFSKPIGEKIACDTGWNIPSIIKEKGFKGEAISCVRSDTPGQLLPFRNNKQKKMCHKKHRFMNEFIYKGDLFGSHLKKCRSNKFESKYGKIWQERISLYAKQKYNIAL